MRGNPPLKREAATQQLQFFLRPQFGLNESIGAHQHAIDRHCQQFNQVMLHLARLSQVGDRHEYIGQSRLAFCLHGIPQKDRKLHKSTHCEQLPRNALIVNYFFKWFTILAFLRLP